MHRQQETSRSLVTHEITDKYGQVHPIKGLGFDGPELYHEADGFKLRRKIWIESVAGEVVWEPGRGQSPGIPEVLRLRDASFPGYVVAESKERADGSWVRTFQNSGSRPVHQSKGKAKKAAKRAPKPAQAESVTVTDSRVADMVSALLGAVR